MNKFLCKKDIVFACLLFSVFSSISARADIGRLPLRLWYDTPARYFEESLPIGNGKIGALVYGGPDVNTIYLNDITFWTGSPVDRNEDEGASRWIPEIREALFREKYAKADSLQVNVQGHDSQYYQPLATMNITDHAPGKVSYYRRELDIDSAVCRDSYMRDGVTYTREYFASNPDHVIAIRLRADRKGALNCSVNLTSQVPHRVAATPRGQLSMTGHAVGDPMNSIHFCAMLRAVSVGGTVSAADSTIIISDATEAVLYFVNATSFNGYDKHPVREAAPYIETAADYAWHIVNYSYDELRRRHIDDYRSLFSRFNLSLAGAVSDTIRTTDRQLKDYTDRHEANPYLETLYVQYGRYLLISCSRTSGVPANLQGLWAPRLWSPWRGNYTVNINLEENYWPAEIAALPEMVRPLDTFVAALADNGRYTARNYYGVESGWCSSHNSDIWAMTNPVGGKTGRPVWANWNMGGAWLVNTLWEHYLFGQDNDYLRNVAYPLMRGATEFCLGWLVGNPHEPDELITAPSTSPENEYIDFQGYHGMTLYGATADLAIMRELLGNTATAASILGLDTALQNRIEVALSKLRPYKVGRKGNLREWYYDWDDQDPHHRHQSHLIGLYPGSHITDSVLMRACARTLELKGDETTGWSTGWRVNLWARLHNARKAYGMYRRLLTYVTPDDANTTDYRSGGTYPNLFDAHPPFQIDGNFGGTAGVCEMLVQSDNGVIELLPALPDEWREGHVEGIRARGGYTLSVSWKDGKVVSASIKANNTNKVHVLCNGVSVTMKIRGGKTKKLKI